MKYYILFCIIIFCISYYQSWNTDCYNKDCTFVGSIMDCKGSTVLDCSCHGNGQMFSSVLDCHQYKIKELDERLNKLEKE